MSSKPIPEESETPAPAADETIIDGNDADGTAPVDAAPGDDLEADAIEPEQEEPADEPEPDAEDEPAEPADEVEEGDETEAEAETGDDAQVAATLAAARGKPEPKAEPKAQPKAKEEQAPEPDEIEDEIKRIEDEVDPAVAKVLRSLHAQNKSLLAEKQEQSAESYSKAVHAAFDARASQGKHDLYGSHSGGKLTDGQKEARKFVHDVANEKFQRLGGKTIGGKVYEFADAVESAEREMLELLGKAPAAKGQPARTSTNKDAAAVQRHKARTALPRGSTSDRGSGALDPNDIDGTAPSRK